MTLSKILSNHKRTPLSDEEIKILQDNNYRFDENTPDRIRYNPDMIVYMLGVDTSLVDLYDSSTIKGLKSASPYALYKTFELLEKEFLPYDHLEYAPLYNISKTYDSPQNTFESLVIIRDIKNCNPRTTDFEKIKRLRDVEWNWEYAFMDDKDKEIIIRALIHNKIPASVLPNLLLTDPLVIKAYTSKLAPYTQECVLRALTAVEYIPDIEENFCIAHGVTDIEAYIYEYMVCYNEKEPSDIVQLSAIKIYIQKLLDRNNVQGVDVTLNIFSTDEDNYGFYRDGHICLATYPGREYDEMAKVGAHETFHAIQHYNIRNLNFEAEPDIDTYTKDSFLRDFFCVTKEMDYYEVNYTSISTEFDAEYRAKIEYYNIENTQTEDEFETLRMTIEEKAEEEQEILRDLSYQTAYSYTRTRINEHGERVHLDDFVEEKLIELRDKHNDYDYFLSTIESLYPMLMYEYHISEDDIHKKTPQELLQELENSNDYVSIGVYTGLIKSSMNPMKNKDWDKNIEYYESMLEREDIPHYVKITIRNNLEEAQRSKYLGLIKLDSYDV